MAHNFRIGIPQGSHGRHHDEADVLERRSSQSFRSPTGVLGAVCGSENTIIDIMQPKRNHIESAESTLLGSVEPTQMIQRSSWTERARLLCISLVFAQIPAVAWMFAPGTVVTPTRFWTLLGVSAIVLGVIVVAALAVRSKERAVQRRLDESERERDFLAQMVRSEPACVKTVSRDLRLLEMNPAGLKMIGAPDMESVRGADLAAVIHPDHLEQFRQLNDRVFNGEHVTEQFRIISLDGTRRWMETHAVPMLRQDGEIDSHLAVTYDITERIRQEEALRAVTSRLQALIDTAVDGVLVLNQQGRVEQVNPAAEALFRCDDRPLEGLSFMDLIGASADGPKERFEDFVERYRKASRGATIRSSGEETGTRTGSDTFPMMVSFGEIEAAAGGGYMVITHDLSGYAKTRAQLVQAQKMEAVGQLSGGIAHDFNNVLTVIAGNAEFLRESVEGRPGPDTPELLEMLDTITDAGDRGMSLTQRMLAFGRRQTLRPESTECAELVREMQRWLGRTLRDDVQLRSEFDDELPPIFADRAQLDSAILNLAINAQDAMPAGGTLSFGAHNFRLTDAEAADNLGLKIGHYVVLSVTDTGTGMPVEVQRRALDPFFTTKSVGHGTGLGLPMVYGFVKQSGGDLTITSQEGLGTTVRMYLPAAEGPSKSKRETDHKSASLCTAQASATPRSTILVVEDDALVRNYATRVIGSMGHEVVAVANGVEALAALDEHSSVDLVLTDAVMPGSLSGIELSDLMKVKRPGMPVLLMSGYAMESLQKQGRLHPDTPFISKPFRKSALEQMVACLLMQSSDEGPCADPDHRPGHHHTAVRAHPSTAVASL